MIQRRWTWHRAAPVATVDPELARCGSWRHGPPKRRPGRFGSRPAVVLAVLAALLGLSPTLGLTPLRAAAGMTAPAQQGADLQPVTILLMGVDARPGEAIDIGVRPDALAVLHLDPATGSCRLLSIPRDTRVGVPDYGLTKVNHALMVGGVPLQQEVVGQFLGITLDHYALIDFVGTEQLIDAIGGVTITNPSPFALGDHTFPAGAQVLNGEQALAYARYRGGPDGDFGRIGRQQDLIRAALAVLADRDVAGVIRAVLPVLTDHVRTDLSAIEMIAWATRLRGACSAATIEMLTLEGTIGMFSDPLFGAALSYVVVEEEEVRRKVAALTRSA